MNGTKQVGRVRYTIIAMLFIASVINYADRANMFGNLSSISTPIVIGYIVDVTGSFDGALGFVAANAVVATLSYLLLTGKIQRLELAPAAA